MIRSVWLALFICSLEACVERKAEFGKICVCNSTYCDTIKLGTISSGKIKVFMTSNEKPGYNVREENFSGDKNDSVTSIKISRNIEYQKILGFGGAFTDSAGHSIKLLPEDAQKKVIESYFSDDGIEYSMARVPLGGSDYSPSFYTLDDHEGDDFELKHFALHAEDLNHKIPFMKQAFALRKNKPLRLFTSTWNIPAWMRHSPGYTIVKKTHYQVYADYYKRYFDEMLKHGIKFHAMATQNEAIAGLMPGGIAGVFWKPRELKKFIRDHLGPTLKNSSHDIKVFLHDDNWGYTPFLTNPVVTDDEAAKYIEAIAFHFGSFGNLELGALELSQNKNKTFLLVNSEACYFVTRPFLGDWGRASNYVDKVLKHLQVGFSAWTDWNMVLNSTGGPNSLNLNGDAPIVISADQKEFFKQPYFYAFGHFSKFVPPDSVRIDAAVGNNVNLQVVAFVRPDNLTSIIVHNKDRINPTKVQVSDNGRLSAVLDIPAASIQTFIY